MFHAVLPAPWAGVVPFLLWLVILAGIGPAIDGAVGLYRFIQHHRAVRRALKQISTASGGAANDGMDG